MTGPAASVVLSTVPDAHGAEEIATRLVDEGLAACVNVVGGVRSVYRWEGRTERAEETLLVIKTATPRVPELVARISALHPYDLPEVVALPVRGGSDRYLAWVLDASGGAGGTP